jgi:predicted nucleic acid-binding protein
VTVYPDTSFLCALYREQENSKDADAIFNKLAEPLTVSALLLFEFRQSVRWQVFLNKKDRSKGYGEREGAEMLANLGDDLTAGLLEIAAVDWAGVIATAEQLSAQHTSKSGYRGFDVMHVATAMELGAKEFLTFDERQRGLAKGTGLKVRP